MPKKSPLNRSALPATVGLVKEVRSELIARIDSVDHKVDSLSHKFDGLNSKFEGLNSKFEGLNSKFEGLNSNFDALNHSFDALRSETDSKFQQILAVAHRTQTLMEEQRAENRIVLDGLQNVTERQDRMEGDLSEVKQLVIALGKHTNA